MQIVIDIPESVKQAFDKATEDDIYGCYYDYNSIIGRAIKNGVPLETKQKMGRWILTDDNFVYCSECEDSYYPRPIDASWYYCPHCGAKMAESEGT